MSCTATPTDPALPVDGAVDLATVERLAEAWCTALDPAVLAGADAAAGAERLALMIRRFQAAQLALATRAAECNAYAARAHSAADWLAQQNGTTAFQARRALDTARRLDACPQTKTAFLVGEISTDEADAVTDAATVDPRSEQRLLDGARARHDLRETRQAADKIRRAARSAEDDAARHARLHQTRSLRIGETRDGHVELRGQFTPTAFASVKPIIDAHLKLRVEQARREGTRDSWDAYRADALLSALTNGATITTRAGGGASRPTATTPAHHREPATTSAPAATSPFHTGTALDRPSQPAAAVVGATPAMADTAPAPSSRLAAADPVVGRTDGSTIQASAEPDGLAATSTDTGSDSGTDQGRLFSPGGDVGQAEGLDPKIDWQLVILVDGIALKRGWAAPGETCEIPGIGTIPIPWIETLLPDIHTEMLIHDSTDIRAYATTTRHRTRAVELAVRVRDRQCVIPRCHRDPTEFDHRTPYTDTHDTSVANGNRLCTPDHRDKTHHGATLHRTDTHWHYWPPGTDPATHPPMTAPIGAHLTSWNLDHLPGDDLDPLFIADPGDAATDGTGDPPSLDLGR